MAPNRKQQGFSLVEVSLALAILALAVFPVVGLLGLGLDTASDARKITTSSLVANHLIGRVQQADGEQVELWQAATTPLDYFYDADGQFLGTALADQQAASYTARLSFPTGAAASPTLGLGTGAVANDFLNQFAVLVSAGQGTIGTTQLDAGDTSIRRYPSLGVLVEKEETP